MMKERTHSEKQLLISDRVFVFSILSILLLTFIVYLPSLQNDFTNWDDDKYVTESLLIRSISLPIIFTSFSVGLYTPITTLSYAIDYQFFELNAWGFHLTSLCLHLLATWLVIVFIHKLVDNKFIALVTGLLFAIHPTHVEAVAWASSRKDVLFTCFSLLSLIAYLDFQTNRKKLAYAACFFTYILACLSKPTAIGLPIAFVALDYFKTDSFKAKLLINKVPFLAVSLVVLLVGIYGIKTLNIKVIPETGYNLWQVVCMASYGFVFYFYKALLPLRLSSYHLYPFPGKDIPVEYQMAPFLLALIIFLFVKYRKQIPGLNIGLVLFFVLLLPTYRVYPAGYPIVAERYLYLSSIGLFFIAASFINKFFYSRSGVPNIATITISILFIVIFTGATFARTKVWKNSSSLWSNAIKVYPDLYYAYDQRGKYLLSIGNKEGAIADFNKSLSLQPNNPELLNLTSTLLYEKGDTVNAKKYIEETLKKDTANYVFYYNRANILKAEGKYQESLADYDKCLTLNPGLAQAYNNRGVSKIFLGDTVGAHDDFVKAVVLNPDDAMFADNLKRVTQLLDK